VRRIQTLGIAAMMALALTAMLGVASASADKFNVSVEPNKWSGTLSGGEHKLNFGETYECSTASFIGGEIKTKSFEKAAVSPELGSCRFRGVLFVNWKINGCKFLFHAGGGGVGTIDITSCEKPMTVEASGCRIEIDNQRGLGPVTYKNSAKLETITATAALTGITYTRNGCSSWANGTFSDGTYSGAWTIKGSTTSGIPASTWDESAAVPPISAFAFEQAPATVKSEYVSGGPRFPLMTENGGNEVYCKRFGLSGNSSSALTGTLSLVPSFKECTVGLGVVPDSNISAGSCSYILHANGAFDIGGEGCASNPISFTSSTGCVVTVGPQSFAEGLTFKSEGVGKLQTLSIPSGEGSAKITGVTYTATGASCAKPGTFSTSKLSLRGTLAATNSLGAAQGIWRE
jgi:hypothetical protein